MLKTNKKNITILIILGIAVLFAFAWSTSPFYTFIGKDTDCFKLMGRLTKEGLIPYKDFFDHKGPLTPFIECIGYGLFNNTIILFILEIVCISFSLIGIYKICLLFLKERVALVISILSIVFLLIGITSETEGGNITEEWSLPFIVFSTYYLSRYFVGIKTNATHNKIYSLLYGITMAVCFGTRITNGIAIAMGLLLVYILLLKNKEFINLLHNILMFLLGFLVIIVPIIIWFAAKGALSEMLYASVVYNIRYASNNYYQGNIIGKIILYVLPLIAVLIVSMYNIIKKNDITFNVFLIMQSVITMAFYLSGAMYAHYFYSYVLILVLALAYCLKLKNKIYYLTIICFGLFIALLTAKITINELRVINNTYDKKIVKNIDKIGNIIKKSDDKNMLAYNTKCVVYLRTNLKPCYRNFSLQDFQCEKDKQLKTGFIKDLKTKKAKWIVIENSGESVFKSIKEGPLLKKLNYKPYFKNQSYVLLKDVSK